MIDVKKLLDKNSDINDYNTYEWTMWSLIVSAAKFEIENGADYFLQYYAYPNLRMMAVDDLFSHSVTVSATWAGDPPVDLNVVWYSFEYPTLHEMVYFSLKALLEIKERELPGWKDSWWMAVNHFVVMPNRFDKDVFYKLRKAWAQKIDMSELLPELKQQAIASRTYNCEQFYGGDE